MKLKNYQEDLVLYVADIVIKDRPDVAADKDLLHDVAAYTLNRIGHTNDFKPGALQHLLAQPGHTHVVVQNHDDFVHKVFIE